MNRAPLLPGSGGVGVRYWEGGGWVGMTKRRKERKTKTKKKKKEEKRALQKTLYKSVCCNVSHRKNVFSQTKWKQKLQTETATAAKSILF